MSSTTMKKRESNSSVQQAKPVRRKYDEEFKQQALMMVRNGQSARSVAEAPGISENLLHHILRKNRLAAPRVSFRAEHKVNRLACGIHSAVEVRPFPSDF